MSEQLRVMISSTARDLPEHREKVMHACLRLGVVHPEMMEHLSAENAKAAQVSLRMVEDADLYLGIFGSRYGYIPPGSDISVTEMEYNRAVARGIPRLIFLMHDDHPVKQADVETGDGAAKLKALKERVKTDRVVGFFKSPDELLALVIQSLSEIRLRNLTAFHYISNIPTPPDEYIAHPYTLLQTETLIGRKPELKLLTDWITGKELEFDGRKVTADSVRIMSVIAIGGMGKSALTWKWFKDIAPEEMNPLAGGMWWSFYESDATFENFIIRALTYVSGRSLEEVTQLPAPDRESQLLAALERESFLFVLDGLERILIAYARMDASRLDDSDVGMEKGLRKTADPRVGGFLKKLAQVKRSRFLVSSRLYPAELETDAGDSIPGAFRLRIEGLTDEDALDLWRTFGVSGPRDELIPIFNTFGKHPLLIQALAGEVKRHRRAPGNFEEWRKFNPRFDPAKFPDLTKAMGHVLEFALRGLDDKTRRVLHIIAAFRMPGTYDTLTALLVGRRKTRFQLSTGKLLTEEGKLFDEETNLDEVLTELEDRGLLGWDKRANRYDLHPIVRGVIWTALNDKVRRGVHTRLSDHFGALPTIDNYLKVSSFEDLTAPIELYNALIGLGRYDDAQVIFYERLDMPALYRLSANRQRIELIEMLFPDGLDKLPRLSRPSAQSYTLNTLGIGYQFNGQPGHASSLFRRNIAIRSELKDDLSLTASMCNLSDTLRHLGQLYESEACAIRALLIARRRKDLFAEGGSLNWLGMALAARGIEHDSESALQRALRIDAAQSDSQTKGIDNSFLAHRAIWLGEFAVARSFANCAWELAQVQNNKGDFIRASRMQGAAALGLGDYSTANERLHHALSHARMVNLIEEELPTLVALAELQRRQKDLKGAREILDDVWEMAERGPYPLFHADAFNVLAQIEIDQGNTVAAVEAAMRTYRFAWCDGPPFAYHWGLEKGKKHLKELRAPEPEMPLFDESRFERMPEVEINPDDEFHVEDEALQ